VEEIDRIPAYYGERDGGFWVAVRGDKVVGTFGLERGSDEAMELRRMYVNPSARRQGIAPQMLQFAEDECRRRRVKRLELGTAEIQQAALALYGNAGYRLVRVETVEALSNKTVGSGIRRYYPETRRRGSGECSTHGNAGLIDFTISRFERIGVLTVLVMLQIKSYGQGR
jgi:RimJ/RimL family protein N-acetyltransferase